MVTFPAVARQAGVSRTFLYENPEARALVEQAVHRTGRPHTPADRDSEQETTWRERALNAEDALKAAHAEIRTQRTRIAQLLGQIRDLENEYPQDSVARISAENTTLKQRLRQAERDTRTLQERLDAARSNLRFQDRRLASVEAELLDRSP
jgi:chromosome segregation ATPase